MSKHSADRLSEPVRLEGGARWSVIAAALGILGLAATVLLSAGAENGRELFFRSYLQNYTFYLSLALGGLFFTMVTHLTRAGWSVTLRRNAEVFGWMLLPMAILGVVVVLGLHDLYEWSHEDVVAGDPLLQHKQPFLNPTFFIVRLVIYFVVWNVLAQIFLRGSLAQDRSADPRITERLERIAAPGTILFALTVTFASFDLLMSLYPHWYSTIFGVYFFAGSTLGYFAVAPIVFWALQRAGRLERLVTVEHYHDMGKLMFAFVVFWAYIAFSQFFLIWYGNLPEETFWFEMRQRGDWVWISLLLLFGHFMLPFLWLISRHPKRRKAVLVSAAIWLLAMHWLDLFYLVMPGSRAEGSLFHLQDLTCFIGLGGIFCAVLLWRLRTVDLIPVKDPRLGESLGFENV